MDVPERQVIRQKEGKKQGRWELRKAKIMQFGGMFIEEDTIVFTDRASDGNAGVAGFIGMRRIDSNGNGLIDLVALGNAGEFSLVGSIIPGFDAGGAGVGSFLGSASRAYGLVRSYLFSTASDARLKKEVKDITYGLDTIKKLRPVSYKFKKGEDVTKLGFIAQEMMEHLPEVVDGSEDTNYGVSYDEVIPVLVKAVQELSAEVETLRAELKKESQEVV